MLASSEPKSQLFLLQRDLSSPQNNRVQSTLFGVCEPHVQAGSRKEVGSLFRLLSHIPTLLPTIYWA